MRRFSRSACSIGSVDPTCAAGLTVDLAVYRALSVAGTCVTVAVTAQNARKVSDVKPLGARSVRRQLEAIWEQTDPAAVCIGLVPDVASMRAIRSFLARLRKPPAVVLDPVIASSSGYAFYGPREVAELRKLFALATLVTPNADEAAVLAGRTIDDETDTIEAATKIAQAGCAVLVTGGQFSARQCTDILAHRGVVRRYSGARLRKTLRGSGGILAAAITAGLSQGLALGPSIVRARAFVHRAFRTARRLGSGIPQFAP